MIFVKMQFGGRGREVIISRVSPQQKEQGVFFWIQLSPSQNWIQLTQSQNMFPACAAICFIVLSLEFTQNKGAIELNAKTYNNNAFLEIPIFAS